MEEPEVKPIKKKSKSKSKPKTITKSEWDWENEQRLRDDEARDFFLYEDYKTDRWG